ncbi:MAG: hypothetical protein HRT94_02175 [Alphaproteobacteria bacterium]|nr:hypothetical protein [Alphaproteobacteria bacterium]
MYIMILTFLAFIAIMHSPAKAQEVSIEEKTITMAFVNYQTALIYDEICNGTDPKDRYDFEKPENVNLIGHEQMLAARLGGLIKVRMPQISVDDTVKRMTLMRDHTRESVSKKLEEIGCDSDETQSTQSLLNFFSNAHPAQLYAFIDKQITDAGGTITPPEKIEGIAREND